MILPIIAYGNAVLRQKNQEVGPNTPDLETFIGDLFETMDNASGVGLAAPQVGRSLRLFVVDGGPMAERYPGEPELLTFRQVFLNPQILQQEGEPWAFEEGCLSIPGIRESVSRKPQLTIRYCDAQFNERTETYSGIRARIIQHEYDHLEGVLFIDYLSPLKKQLLQPKLQRIARGAMQEDYPMSYTRRTRARR